MICAKSYEKLKSTLGTKNTQDLQITRDKSM